MRASGLKGRRGGDDGRIITRDNRKANTAKIQIKPQFKLERGNQEKWQTSKTTKSLDRKTIAWQALDDYGN